MQVWKHHHNQASVRAETWQNAQAANQRNPKIALAALRHQRQTLQPVERAADHNEAIAHRKWLFRIFHHHQTHQNDQRIVLAANHKQVVANLQ